MSESLLETAVRKLGPEAVAQALNAEQREALRYEWEAWARPEQILPTLHPGTGKPWFVALLLAGRGFGKSRAGSEWVRQTARTGRYPLVNLIGATVDDARDIMIEGESGILAVCPPGERPRYLKSDRQLEWPNGAKSLIFTADEPDRLRGKQHMKVWADEVGAWRYDEAWDQMLLGLRLGDCPQVVATTTPRPRKLIRGVLKDADTYIVRGSTYDNAANLAEKFISKMREKYEGTRLGRQELYAELLEDVAGALWNRDLIDELRVDAAPEMRRIVVAVDPSGGAEENNDEQGIVACGKGIDGHGYVIADRSCSLSPDGWGRRTVELYRELEADCIVAEANYGGDMVEHVIMTAARSMGVRVRFKLTKATRGKAVRAEPIAALHEQKRQHHIGNFPVLEDQLCSMTANGMEQIQGERKKGDSKLRKRSMSPDRADAMVWAMSELFLEEESGADLLRRIYSKP